MTTQDLHPFVTPCIFPKAKSGFEPDMRSGYCRHAEHLPPSHLHIPEGKQYRHVCPACRAQFVLRSNGATL